MGDVYSDSTVVELNPADFIKKDNKLYIRNDQFNGKPSLIKFYAPWCPHCTKMKPLLEELKTKFKNKDFQIGALNCDKYNIDHLINIDGFPTLFFVKRSTGHLVEYGLDRNMESLSKFIENHYDKSNNEISKENINNKLNKKVITGNINVVILDGGAMIKRHNFIVTVENKNHPIFVLNGMNVKDSHIQLKLGEQLHFDQTGVSNTSDGSTNDNHPIIIKDSKNSKNSKDTNNAKYYLDNNEINYKDFRENFLTKNKKREVIFTPTKKGEYHLLCDTHGSQMGCSIIVN